MSLNHFNRAAAAYAESRPDYPQLVVKALEDHLPNEGRRAPVLDVGCGPGNFTRALEQRGHTAIGLDPSSEMLSAATALPGVHAFWVQARGEQLPIRNEALSCVICSQSLHWIDERSLLPEARRCLKPTGIFAVAWQAPVKECDLVEVFIQDVLSETIGLQPDQAGRRRDMDQVVDCLTDDWQPIMTFDHRYSVQWSPTQISQYLKSRIPAASDRLITHTATLAQASFGDSLTVEFQSHLRCWVPV